MFTSEGSDVKAVTSPGSHADINTSLDITQSGSTEPIKILLFPPKNKKFRFDEGTNRIEIEPIPWEGSENVPPSETSLTPLVKSCNITGTPTPDCAPFVFTKDTKSDERLHVKQILQIRKTFENSKLKDECFLKGCKWSGDGLCLLTNSEDNLLRLFEIGNGLDSQPQGDLEPVLQMKEGGLVYDYAWYPKMNSSDPVSCVFACTSQNSPIHLWDAYTGHLRATYQPINQYDEVTSAFSLAFTPDGSKIYSGFKKCLRIFDISLPGRISEERNLKTKGTPFQSNIISTICVNPSMTNLYAMGSYDKTIGIYTEPNGELLCILKGHCGGITQVMFSSDGNYLFSGARKDNEILCWDMRNPGKVVFSVERVVETQQKIQFDLSPDQTYLITGFNSSILTMTAGCEGCRNVFPIVISFRGVKTKFIMCFISGTTESNIKIVNIKNQNEKVLKPTAHFKGHDDCVNGVQFHPNLPIFASSSGQRHLPEPPTEDEENDYDVNKNFSVDNSIKIWSFSPLTADAL